jgi:hypothetical protein
VFEKGLLSAFSRLNFCVHFRIQPGDGGGQQAARPAFFPIANLYEDIF